MKQRRKTQNNAMMNPQDLDPKSNFVYKLAPLIQSPPPQESGLNSRKTRYWIAGGIFFFSIALVILIVCLMILRGPALTQ